MFGKIIRSSKSIFLTISVSIFLVFTLFPVVWTFITSISTRSELMAMPKHWIPSKPTFENYYALFTGKPLPGFFASTAPSEFGAALRNSLIVTLSCLVIGLPIEILAGFAFSTLRFPFKKYFFHGIFAIVLLPHIAILPALYDMFTGFGLIDTYLALVLFDLSWSTPLGIWLMASYFSTIPREIIKAARVDGCTWKDVLIKVVLPISTPIIIAVAIIQFTVVWNDFIGPLVFCETIACKTLPVVLAEFVGLTGIDYGGMAAGAIIATLPALIFALVFQKYIIRGLTIGATKY